MKRIISMCCVFAFLLALSAAAAAQSKGANFAGTWELDKSKSQLPQMMADNLTSMTWTVTQDDKQITREQKMEGMQGGGGGGGGRGGGMMGGGRPLTVKLDGTESTMENPRGKSTVKAGWKDDGKILEINTDSTFSGPNGEMTMKSVEHWELADGGKTLKVHQSRETPRGQMESTLVFTKK